AQYEPVRRIDVAIGGVAVVTGNVAVVIKPPHLRKVAGCCRRSVGVVNGQKGTVSQREQKHVGAAIAALIPPQHLPVITNSPDFRVAGAGKLNRGKDAPTVNKTVFLSAVAAPCVVVTTVINIGARKISGRIDVICPSILGAGEIHRPVNAFLEDVTVELLAGEVQANDDTIG